MMGKRGAEWAQTESLFLDTRMYEIKRMAARLSKNTPSGKLQAARLTGYIEQFYTLPRPTQERIDTWVVHASEWRGLGVQGAFELAMVIYNHLQARRIGMAELERHFDGPRTRMIG